MAASKKFFRCSHCGNLVGVIQDSGVPMICCGEPMTLLVPNTSDGAKEKHVPVLTREVNTLHVAVCKLAPFLSMSIATCMASGLPSVDPASLFCIER